MTHPEDASATWLEELLRFGGHQTSCRYPLGADCDCGWAEVYGRAVKEKVYPEDAPGGSWKVRPSIKAITGVDWCVDATDETAGVFYGPKGLCEYVRSALNRFKGDET